MTQKKTGDPPQKNYNHIGRPPHPPPSRIRLIFNRFDTCRPKVMLPTPSCTRQQNCVAILVTAAWRVKFQGNHPPLPIRQGNSKNLWEKNSCTALHNKCTSIHTLLCTLLSYTMKCCTSEAVLSVPTVSPIRQFLLRLFFVVVVVVALCWLLALPSRCPAFYQSQKPPCCRPARVRTKENHNN